MTEKRRCPNCGAYLSVRDKVCYVCGETLPPVSKPVSTSGKRINPVVFEPEKDTDFVMPVDHDTAGEKPFEERKPYSDDDYVEPYKDNYDNKNYSERDVEPYYYDDRNDYGGGHNMNTGKVAKICGVILGIVALAAIIIGVCFATGLLGGGASGEQITVYFDKPSVNINLMDDTGTVYNWGADVSVCYTFNGKEEEQGASPCKEYDNTWKCEIPAGATDLYFAQTVGDEIRTTATKAVEKDNIYYVTDILLNSDDQLPLAFCKLSEFGNLGVNAVEETASTKAKKKETTAPPTEAETETEEETEPETEKPTQALSKPYNISLTSDWVSGTTKSKSGNCVTYYEKYNYKNYGSGMLLSIYTFKAGDNSYGDLNAKKILTASDGSKVVVVTPSDVECDDSDEKAIEKYTSLQSQTNEIISSISTN